MRPEVMRGVEKKKCPTGGLRLVRTCKVEGERTGLDICGGEKGEEKKIRRALNNKIWGHYRFFHVLQGATQGNLKAVLA